ncbi:hypothetical protein NUW58_g1292 [Xylaria curta]|uniref:Uncharacterized protein n=1 Tax=Xylaria curta TaxID=42375 RepID=A0ACC1PLV0_9PEZI|nr:hypothetical protein NUW58_g1292 [Xylaria curta]
MDGNGSHAKDKRSDSDAKSKDNTPSTANTPTDTNKSPRKRRKVNHAARDESDSQTELSRNSIDRSTNAMVPPSFDSTSSQGTKPGFGPLGQGNHLQLVSPNAVSGLQTGTSGSNMNQSGFSDAWLTAQNQFHDMHHYNPQYMLPQEVTHEFNLLNDFLNTSLLDENGALTDEQNLIYRNQSQSQSGQADAAGFLGNPLPPSAMEVGSMPPPSTERNTILRPKSAVPADKTREFYLQAADPSGNDTPEARMQRVLKAKYDAGLLKPFNYIKGYARLSHYMDGHIAPASKQKILRQLDRFRPKFREKVQGLTDMELVYVEMWFEKSLMEYDRVFASMAVPACCWRRSGEIFRGNKEMAELIHVPVERLRDGKISIHEVMTEDSLVRYWEEFGTIAFDPAHDTLLTACALKNPDDRSNDPTVNCCFSFMIRRDEHKILSTYEEVGNTAERKVLSIAAHPHLLREIVHYTAHIDFYTGFCAMSYLEVLISTPQLQVRVLYNPTTQGSVSALAVLEASHWVRGATYIVIKRRQHHEGPFRDSWSQQSAIMEHSNPPSTTKKSQLVDAVVQLSSNLRTKSSDETADSSLQDLNNEIENQIQTLKAYNPRLLSPGHRAELNTAGLALWNWCTQANRRQGDNAPCMRNKFFCLVRVLSFSMIILAHQSNDNSSRIIIYLERLAIKTGRSCITNDQLGFGLWALQKAVEYNGLLQQLQGPSIEESRTRNQFEAEYSTLRIAWKEDRMDVAEHLYTSLEKLMPGVDITLSEKLADAIFEIGRDLALQKNSVLAAKWLERAYELINAQELGHLSRDAIELRLAISQALIQVYLDIGELEYIKRAENHIAYIEGELGDKLVVLLFRTEVLLRSPAEVFDSKAYADILRRMIKSVDMSESSFKLLIHHIRKLDEKNHLAASSILDELLMTCITISQREQWFEKAVVLRIDMAVRDGSLESIPPLEAVLDQVLPSMGKPLSVNTAAGIQTLVWKRADAEFNQEGFDAAAKWCTFALHPALEQSGPSNVAKMTRDLRKLLLCAIKLDDLSAASKILQTMDDAALKEPMTAYLAFKVALRQQDVNSASKSLEQISETSSPDPQYLYACCLEAQQAQDKISTIKALQQIAMRHRFHGPNSIHTPALLRVLIRLEVSVLSDKQETGVDKESLVEDICNIFKAAVEEIQKERQDGKSDKLFTIDELDWFCKNAYNLALENTMIWGARHVITILECCLSIMSQYPQDISAQMAADISLRGMFCNFMAATVLLALARVEDNAETRLQDYLSMRRHIQRYDEALESRSDSLDEASRDDLRAKLSTLLVFEARLGHSLLAYQAMADCILRCQAVPSLTLYQTMRELINEIWTLENFDNEKLARYMRCLLKVTLPMEHKIPLNVIGEISAMVKQLAQKKKYFPLMELEWITITAFNHGVDLYGIHEDELSRAWIAHALTNAHYIQDGGELERQLQNKNTKLKWDDAQVVET